MIRGPLAIYIDVTWLMKHECLAFHSSTLVRYINKILSWIPETLAYAFAAKRTDSVCQWASKLCARARWVPGPAHPDTFHILTLMPCLRVLRSDLSRPNHPGPYGLLAGLYLDLTCWYHVFLSRLFSSSPTHPSVPPYTATTTLSACQANELSSTNTSCSGWYLPILAMYSRHFWAERSATTCVIYKID